MGKRAERPNEGCVTRKRKMRCCSKLSVKTGDNAGRRRFYIYCLWDVLEERMLIWYYCHNGNGHDEAPHPVLYHVLRGSNCGHNMTDCGTLAVRMSVVRSLISDCRAISARPTR